MIFSKDFYSIFLIIMIFMPAVIETDIYLPAFYNIMKYYDQNESSVQNILTWNFYALCISGVFYGPLSDSFGRKKPLLFSLLIFLIGSILTVYASSFYVLLIGRIVQGIGAGGSFSLGTAIIFDLYNKEKAISVLNIINVIVPVIMACAPLIGSVLNEYFGFKSIFGFILLFVFASISLVFLGFKETLEPKKRIEFKFFESIKNVIVIIRDIRFIYLSLLVTLVFAGLLVFLANSSLLYIREYRIRESYYPFYHSLVLLSYLTASIFSKKILKKFGIAWLKKMGLFCVVLASSSIFIISVFLKENPIIYTFLMMIYAAGFIWIQTPYFAELMTSLPYDKGVLSSVFSSLRLVMTGLIINVTASFYNKTMIPISITLVLISLYLLYASYQYEKLVRKVISYAK